MLSITSFCTACPMLPLEPLLESSMNLSMGSTLSVGCAALARVTERGQTLPLLPSEVNLVSR